MVTVTAFLRWILAMVNIQFSMGKPGARPAPKPLTNVQNAVQRAQMQGASYG